MRTNHLESGVAEDDRTKLTGVLGKLTSELQFTPGSQPKITLEVEDLELLLQAAHDVEHARGLYEVVSIAADGLRQVGLLHQIPEINRTLSAYEERHRDLTIDPPHIA
jgi:hypothetical protein